jgi:hypothetical protein
MDAPDEPEEVVIAFRTGCPSASTVGSCPCPSSSTSSTRRAGAHGVGRIDMIEDRLVGIKSREIYECPAAITLITAHRDLEDLCLEQELADHKRAEEGRYAQLIYNGLWWGPLKKALDAFIDEANRYVNGEVRVQLFKGNGDGRRSAQRGLGALQLRDGDLRRGRPVRPDPGRGLREAVGSAAQDLGRACTTRSHGETSCDGHEQEPRPDAGRLWGGRFTAGPDEAAWALGVSTASTGSCGGRTSPARRPTPTSCTASPCSTTTSGTRMLDARSTAAASVVRAGRLPVPPRPTRTSTAPSSAGSWTQLGPLGGKLRAGRSRNDQIASDLQAVVS